MKGLQNRVMSTGRGIQINQALQIIFMILIRKLKCILILKKCQQRN